MSGILIGITTSVYSLFRISMTRDQSRAELSQNARIALDRLTRELRQTPYIVTELPADRGDTSVPQPGEIEFEDGHAEPGDSNYLTYRYYYVSQGILKLEIKEYYFSSNPSQRVRQSDIGVGGEHPVENILSVPAIDISENVQSIAFYGSNLLDVQINTADGQNQSYSLRTQVVGRNL